MRYLEKLFLIFGVLAVTAFAAIYLHRSFSSKIALDKFHKVREQSSAGVGENTIMMPMEAVDFSLWSEGRISAFKESLKKYSASPIAVLKIPKIDLEVPVFDGTDELTLNRGVGRIRGTTRPGQTGNIGIAGHRDGFFRGLKNIVKGDTVLLLTAFETQTYIVDKIKIVKPEDVSVLHDKGLPLLTLVTCYPFYFVGNAPERWIVQCSLNAARLD